MIQKKFKRELIPHQREAFQGAKLFYQVAIPASIGIIFIAHVYYIVDQQINGTKGHEKIAQYSIAFTVDLLSVISYIFALKLYKQCNLIDTTPVTPRHILLSQQKIIVKQQEQPDTQLIPSLKPGKYFCQQCQCVCDYRTRHCFKCGTCIQRYDHHCFWIGNCVGRHNHRQFYYFLVLQTINNALLLQSISSITQLQQLANWAKWFRIGGGLMALGFLCFTGYLWLYHTMLISCGITTWQHMRRSKISYLRYLPIGFNPFSLGIFKNWKRFLTQSTRASNEQNVEQLDEYIPTFEQAKSIIPAFNIIQNEYYSCC